MAPKSVKDSKGKKALIVSSSTKKQKRKSSEESSKDKIASKKGKTDKPSASSKGNVRYFRDIKGEERYNSIFRSKKIFNGRWIDYKFFDSNNFEFCDKMVFLGWKSLTTSRDDVYPELVQHFYAHAERKENQSTIESFVKGKFISLSKKVLSEILKINLGNAVAMDNVSRKEQLDVVYGNAPVDKDQPMTLNFQLEMKLVHHFACNILVPKAGKYEYVTDKELFLLWAYLTDTIIDLPLLILDHMFKATYTKACLPYGILLSKIFKYFHIDLTDEEKRTPKPFSEEFNARTLKRIRCVKKDGKWVLKKSVEASEDTHTPSASTSRGKAPRKSLLPDSAGVEGDVKFLLDQILGSVDKLHQKTDLISTRMIIVEKKVRELKKEIILLRQEEDNEEKDEEDEDEEKDEEDEDEEKEEEEGAKEYDNAEEISTEPESDIPTLSKGHRYGLRFRPGTKFSNTADKPLILTPSPSSSPSP